MEEKKRGRGRPRKIDKKIEEKESKLSEIKKNQDKLSAKAKARAKQKAEEIIEKDKLKSEIKNDSTEHPKDDSLNNTVDLKSEDSAVAEQGQSDDLKQDTSATSSDSDFNIDIPEDIDIPNEVQEYLSDDYIPDLNIPNDDFDPLKESVIKRKYTDGHLGKREDVQSVDAGDGKDDVDSGTDKPIEPLEPSIPEPEIKQTEPTIELQDKTINKEGGQAQTQTHKAQPKPLINQDLSDLSPNQKRKAAEKTADALVKTYAQLVPVPFKYMSSFNIRKLEKRHMNDELDMYMQVMEDGTRVKDYCEKVNDEVDKIFVVTEEMQKEIKEPLVDVLLEQGFALTPSQRLLLAVGGQIVQMGITSIQLLQQNRSAIEQFKNFHKESKENEEKQEQKRVNDATEKSKAEERKRHEEEELEKELKTDEKIDIPSTEQEESITVEEYLQDDERT